VSSWVKFEVPSGLVNASRMSPCIERLSPSSVRVLYLVSPVTSAFQVWSPTRYLGAQVALNAYVLWPVLLVSFLNTAASVVPSSVRVKLTFRSVTMLWLSVSRTRRFSSSVWLALLLLMLLFPCIVTNSSVSAVTVKLFSAISGVLFWLPSVLLELNL